MLGLHDFFFYLIVTKRVINGDRYKDELKAVRHQLTHATTVVHILHTVTSFLHFIHLV